MSRFASPISVTQPKDLKSILLLAWLADLEIVVDPRIPIPNDEIRLAETFVLTSRYFAVNLDIGLESRYFIVNHPGFC